MYLLAEYLGFTGDSFQNILFPHQFFLKEMAIHISQLLHGTKAIKVLGYVDAAAIKMFTENIRILN